MTALRSGVGGILGRPPRADHLRTQLAQLFGDVAVVPFSSGRAALVEALSLARRVTGRQRVVLPAYTSYSVAAAATKAGAIVDLCDVDPNTLSHDRPALQRIVGSDTAAVLIGNIYGYVDSTADLAWIRDRGALLIDDAAQALGAREHGRPAGVRGDLGVLSFSRGKCVTLGEGGVLLVTNRRVPVPNAPRERSVGITAWVAALGTALAGSPLLFRLLSVMPGLHLGESVYDPDFELGAMSQSAERMAVDVAEAVAAHLATRRAVAAWWRTALASAPQVRVVEPGPACEPAYLRVPILAATHAQREEWVGRLRAVGFRFVRSFPTSLAAIARFRSATSVSGVTIQADDLARRIIALPCHRMVRRADVAAAVGAMGEGPTSLRRRTPATSAVS